MSIHLFTGHGSVNCTRLAAITALQGGSRTAGCFSQGFALLHIASGKATEHPVHEARLLGESRQSPRSSVPTK